MRALKGLDPSEVLHSSRNTAVYRANDPSLGSVIVKIPAGSVVGPRAAAALRREFELGRGLELPGLVRHLELRDDGDGLGLLIEDFGGRSLAARLKDGPLAVGIWFDVAIAAARALGELHGVDLVHKDVTPGNLLLADDGTLKLCDLGLASRIPRSRQAAVAPGVLAGTLPYIAPEQTGRVNRAIDYRTDFYGLGATLFEALTGRPPFSARDAVALLHAHLARTPPQAHSLRAEAPAAVSAILGKLLSKTAEDRYQSAAGLVADLELARAGAPDDFVPGSQDVSAIFQVSQKLYGREVEIAALNAAFERAARGGRELLLVAGYSGIGKSALVHEVQERLLERRGVFAAGKFDQLELARPLSAVREALRDLMGRLLTEDDAELDVWRGRIRGALADEAATLLKVLPELGTILGPLPPVLELSGQQASERFLRLMTALVGVFARPEQPLVFFLDDLQWVDPASLRLLERLADPASGAVGHVLLIGAYRDNEVSASHPLRLTVDALRERGASLSEAHLGPLTVQDVVAITADSTDRRTTEAAELGELVHAKTGGNPFFVVAFLRALADDGLLRPGTGGWSWDLSAIGRLRAIDTAVDLMVDTIERYGPVSRQLLSLASLLGARFELGDVAAIAERSRSEAVEGLWPALRDGLLLPLDEGWELVRDGGDEDAPVRLNFAHDRIQEAAYRAIATEDRGPTHLRVGRLLRARIGEDALESRIFEVVTHLNRGAEHITDPAERAELPQLNLIAARRAHASTAYDVARDCVEAGLGALGDDAWTDVPELAFALHREQIDVEFLLGRVEAAEAAFRALAKRDLAREQAADIYQLMVRVHLMADRPAEGLALGIEALARLGIDLPTDPEEAAGPMDEERARIAAFVDGKEPGHFVNQPEANDPEVEAWMGLLHETWTCSVMAPDGLQMVHTALKIVRLTMEHGTTKFSACGYVAHALVLSMSSQFADARYHGRISMDLAHRFEDPFIIPKVHNTFANFTNHWIEPLRSNAPIYDESYRSCLLSGDRWWGAWAVTWQRTTQLIGGWPLEEVAATQERYHDYIAVSGYAPMTLWSHLDRAILGALTGRSDTPESLDCADEGFDAAATRAEFEGMGFGLGTYLVDLYTGYVQYLHGEEAAAVESLERAEANRDVIPFLMPYSDWWFYSALAWCGVIEPGEDDPRLERVRANIEQMAAWTEGACAANFEHRLRLMEAELARVEQRHADAEEGYLAAIDCARRDHYVQNAALACELAARHQVERGRRQAAVGFVVDAAWHYGRWGATRKLRMLEGEWPSVLGNRDRGGSGTTTGTFISTTSQGLSTQLLDLSTVLRAAEAISGELDLSRLIERILQLGRESAGAEDGELLVLRDGSPVDPRITPPRVAAYVRRTAQPLRLDDALTDARFRDDPVVQERRVRSLYCVPAVKQGRVLAMLYLENNLVTGAFTAERTELLRLLSSQAAVSLENATLYADLKASLERQTALTRSFERFVPKAFLEQLGRASILDVGLGDQVEREIGVLFMDIRDFSTISEALSAAETFAFVNGLLARLGPLVRRHNGFIDKYIGDAIMALFPGPIDEAFDAALAIQRAVTELREAHDEGPFADLRVGVGVHRGTTMLGTIGEPERMDSTVLSDAVNVASRLEGLTKRFGVGVIVSEPARAQAQRSFNTRSLGDAPVKGKRKTVAVHELLD